MLKIILDSHLKQEREENNVNQYYLIFLYENLVLRKKLLSEILIYKK